MNFTDIVQCNKKSKGTNTCEYILLHHTWGGTYSWNLSILSWKTSSYVSCHYLIWGDGKVAKIWEDTDIQRHAGVSEWNGKKYMNKYAIGIECINIWTGFTDIQKNTLRELVNELIAKHKILPTNIIRHKDVSPWRKIDPYDTLWNNEFKTFSAYQNSFIQKEVHEAMIWNSNLRHTIKNNELKKQLNNTNDMIRKIYNITNQ